MFQCQTIQRSLQPKHFKRSRLKQSRFQQSLFLQQGMGLPAAIFIIVVFSLIVAALANIEQRTGDTLGQDVQSSHAFWAAESGAQAGLSVLFPPDGTASDCSDSYFSSTHTIDMDVQGIGGCSFTLVCTVQTDTATPPNNYYSLVSTGSCGSGVDRAQRRVEVGATEMSP